MEKEGSRSDSGPLLLISDGEKQFFYNVLEDKIDCASIPILHNKVVVGSSYGWLVLVDTDTDNCCLWNRECNEVIHLPPLPMSSLYTTCLLSKPPTHPACHILFNSAAKFEQAFCQIGDNEFVHQTLFENPHVQSLEAMVVSSNGNVYGVVGHTERLAFIHFTGGTLELCPILKLPISSPLCANFSRNYLIQGDGDELLIVRRMQPQVHMPYCFDFKVDRVDTNKLECAEVIDIGQRAIFVCRLGQAFCCSVSTGGGIIKPNSIYYTLGDVEARDLYIFTLNNRSLTLLRPCPAARRSRSRTSWVQFTSAKDHIS